MAFFSVDDVAAGFGITPGTLDLLKAGTAMEGAGAYHSLWYATGVPGAGAAPSSGLGGGVLTSDPTMVTGQVPFIKAATGREKRLASFGFTADRAGALLLHDRLWANSGIAPATTTAQTINGATIPSRDANGGTDGIGVMAALEVSSATGNGSPVTTITLSYTNTDGLAGRTATMPSFPATAVAGTMVPFFLQAGDRGIKSVQSITLGTTLVSGTVHVVLYRRLARLAFTRDGGDSADKAWDQTSIVRLYDGSVPFLAWVPRDATAVNLLAGEITFTEH